MSEPLVRDGVVIQPEPMHVGQVAFAVPLHIEHVL